MNFRCESLPILSTVSIYSALATQGPLSVIRMAQNASGGPCTGDPILRRFSQNHGWKLSRFVGIRQKRLERVDQNRLQGGLRHQNDLFFCWFRLRKVIGDAPQSGICLSLYGFVHSNGLNSYKDRP